jgi:serine/threonine protein kinase
MIGGELLAEGGYGCIFYPPIDCKGKQTKNKDYISKIQKNDTSSQNEIFVGTIVSKQIPNFRYYFAPSISKCPLRAEKMNFADVHKCTQINKNKKLVILRMPYTHGKEIDMYIIENNNIKHSLMNILSGYQHLLKGLQLLQDKNICHFDIKTHNILFDTRRNIPILIDFGLSIYTKQIFTKTKFFFYRYIPQYYVWPLEVHVLNYLLNVKNDNGEERTSLTEDDIVTISSEFTRHHKILNKLFSKDIVNMYENLCISYSKKYIGMSKKEIINDIIFFWKTWDNYGLSVVYLKLIQFLSPKGFSNNSFIIHFSQLLFENIHPNPQKRHDLEITISKFEAFFYDQTINNTSNYEKMFTQLDTSYKNTKNAISTNKKDMKQLHSISARTS